MRKYLILLFLLTSCGHNVVVNPPAPPPPPETYDQFLMRTESTTCAQLTWKLAEAPDPDCHKIVEALTRGRNRATRLYPEAANFRFGSIFLWQTPIVWNTREVFPRIASGFGVGAAAVTYPCITIYYAFEDTLEHEIIHTIVCSLDGGWMRTQEALDDPRDADQKDFKYIWDITCHNTSDDPFGDGTSISISGRASCIESYTGTKNPLLP